MTFTRETDDDDWAGTIRLRDESYPFTLRASYEPDELESIASSAQGFLESNWQAILDQVTADLLPLYNDEWRDEDAPPLSETDFRKALGSPEIKAVRRTPHRGVHRRAGEPPHLGWDRWLGARQEDKAPIH
jgi:hypothetical protein